MHGLFTALVTPFDSHDVVNEKSLVALLHHQLKGGVDGVVVCGSTGEGNNLEDFERDFVIKCAVRELKGKIPCVVGCGAPSTKQVVEYVKKAEQFGADGILAVTPFYCRPTQEGIYLHFKALSDATRLPICVYNIASRTGQNIETATLNRIAELPNIIGVKEASGNIAQVQDVLEVVQHKKPHFIVTSGDDALALAHISLGAKGLVSVISNLLPKTTKRLVDEAMNCNIPIARALHFALRPLFYGLFVETNPIPLKRMLEHVGFEMGPYRLPLCTPTKANEEKIQHAIQACQHIIDDEFKEIEITKELLEQDW